MDIDSLYYDCIDLLKQMIASPSHSREESTVAGLLESYLQQKSQVTFRKGNNVWVFSSGFDPAKPTVLLNSHIDTVKPVAGWTVDPYIPSEEDGILTGLGSNDAGASVVTLLHAFLYLSRKDQPCNFLFLASCEEEISGKDGVESVLPELPPIAFGIVGEPTGMHPAVAEKGLMVLDCTVYGISGHAARNEGENAIYKALQVIDWFRNYRFPKESPLLGGVKMTVTLIQSGTQHNVVPDRCQFTVDVRTNECYDNPGLFELIREFCGCEVHARSFRLDSSSVPVDHPVVQRAVMMGKEPFGSPTLSDQALMRFPTLKIGPGESSRSHTADEFIRTEEIREALDMYICLLDNLKL